MFHLTSFGYPNASAENVMLSVLTMFLFYFHKVMKAEVSDEVRINGGKREK